MTAGLAWGAADGAETPGGGAGGGGGGLGAGIIGATLRTVGGAGACGLGAGTMPGGVAGRAIIPGGRACSPCCVGSSDASRSARRRSMWMSLSNMEGTARLAGRDAAAQAGQSPTGGSVAPHFRHLDNGSSRLDKAVAT